MRGGLINRFDAEIARYSTGATALDPTPAGDAIQSGYDDDFNEPIVLTDAQGARAPARQETIVRVGCQVETEQFEALQAFNNGVSPGSRVTLVFHFRSLEEAGLVDEATGEALIRMRDRLVAIYERCSDSLVQAVRTPPGLYVTEAKPASFGLGRKRNLLLVTFEDRELGPRG